MDFDSPLKTSTLLSKKITISHATFENIFLSGFAGFLVRSTTPAPLRKTENSISYNIFDYLFMLEDIKKLKINLSFSKRPLQTLV